MGDYEWQTDSRREARAVLVGERIRGFVRACSDGHDPEPSAFVTQTILSPHVLPVSIPALRP